MPNYEHNIQSKNYIKSSKLSWKYYKGASKQQYGNQKKSFNYEKHSADTKHSMEYWRLKELKGQPQIQFFFILKRCRLTKRTSIFCLCLKKKSLFIIEYQEKDVLNQRNELIFNVSSEYGVIWP